MPAGSPACSLVQSAPELDLPPETGQGYGHTGPGANASGLLESLSLWSSLLPLLTLIYGFDFTTEACGSLQMLPCLKPVSEAVILWCLVMVYHDFILGWLLSIYLVGGCGPSSHQLSKFQCHSNIGYFQEAFLEDGYPRHIVPSDFVFVFVIESGNRFTEEGLKPS